MDTGSCPRCGFALGDERLGDLRVYPCRTCAGHAIGVAQLRKAAGRDVFGELWRRARSSRDAGVKCPSCDKLMRAVITNGIEIDACLGCHLIWLDEGEQDKIARLPQVDNDQQAQLDQWMAQQFALESVRLDNERIQDKQMLRRLGVWVEGLFHVVVW